jgi:hypothetical protein
MRPNFNKVAESEVAELNDLTAAMWVQAYDSAWLGQNWELLERLLALDVEFETKHFTDALIGRHSVITYLRDAIKQTRIHEYNATDLKGHSSGPVGIITYRWQLDCTIEEERTETTGRDVLVLSAHEDHWQLVWRAQFRA